MQLDKLSVRSRVGGRDLKLPIQQVHEPSAPLLHARACMVRLELLHASGAAVVQGRPPVAIDGALDHAVQHTLQPCVPQIAALPLRTCCSFRRRRGSSQRHWSPWPLAWRGLRRTFATQVGGQVN